MPISYDGANPLMRLTCATQAIAEARQFGTNLSDEEIFRRNGYQSPNEFWRDALARPQIERYRHLWLVSNFGTRDQSRIKRINDALDDLRLMQPDIFYNDKMIKSREAATAMINMPMIADLVPAGLQAFLERKDPAPDTGVANVRLIVPAKKLEKFLREQEVELGKVPPKHAMFDLAKKHFTRYRVTQKQVFDVHEKCFGKKGPGPRSN
jgi:hypothetical protein